MRDTQYFVPLIIDGIVEVMELDDADDIHAKTKLASDLGFDSFLYVQLIMFAEDCVGDVHIDPAKISADALKSVESLAAYCAALAEEKVAV